MKFTLTATPGQGSPPPSDSNEVRVKLKFSGESRSLKWGGPLRLGGSIGGYISHNHRAGTSSYFIKMRGSNQDVEITLVNQKQGGKPPKGTLKIEVDGASSYCYTKGGVERCSKRGSPGSSSTKINN